MNCSQHSPKDVFGLGAWRLAEDSWLKSGLYWLVHRTNTFRSMVSAPRVNDWHPSWRLFIKTHFVRYTATFSKMVASNRPLRRARAVIDTTHFGIQT